MLFNFYCNFMMTALCGVSVYLTVPCHSSTTTSFFSEQQRLVKSSWSSGVKLYFHETHFAEGRAYLRLVVFILVCIYGFASGVFRGDFPDVSLLGNPRGVMGRVTERHLLHLHALFFLIFMQYITFVGYFCTYVHLFYIGILFVCFIL